MKIKSLFKTKEFLKNPHVQTILTQYLPYPVKPIFRQEKFELSDGDFLELYFSGDLHKGIVLVLHGILGELDSHYMLFSYEGLEELGLGGVFIKARGAGGSINRTPRFFNAADTRDLHEVIVYLQQRFPGVPLFAVGYSLGGVILTKYLAEQDRPLIAAMVVSIPFDLKFCVDHFQSYPGKMYADYMIRHLRKKMMKKFQAHPGVVNLKQLRKVRTFPQFDNLVTAPMNGYRDAEDYYYQGSPKHYLKHIKTPLLIVHAMDDPIVRPEVIPREEDLSEHVTLEISDCGGHLGFIADIKDLKAEYWIKTRMKEFFTAHS